MAVYAVGYAKGHHDRRFYAGLNLFAWAMLAAPLMSSLALLWIAVEVTTIISVSSSAPTLFALSHFPYFTI